MPKKEATAISIKPLEEGHVKITVRGTAPLLVHAWDDKAIGMIKDKQAGKTKKARETRDPEREMNAARYCVVPDETGRYVETEFDNGKAVDAFKATAFKAAMIRAGKLLGYTMTDLKCVFWVENEFVPILDGAGKPYSNANPPELQEDMVRIGMGVSDIRYRPVYKIWQAVLHFKYASGLVNSETIANLCAYAGKMVGVGEWRPEKDGQHGMFEVVGIEEGK